MSSYVPESSRPEFGDFEGPAPRRRRIQYDRDLLLSLQFAELSNRRPDNLPANIPRPLMPRPPRANSQQQTNLQQPGCLKETRRGGGGGSQRKNSEDRDPMKQNEETERNIRSVLSKIAVQSLESCVGQLIIRCGIGSFSGLTTCVDVVFDMAIQTRQQASTFTELCKRLAHFKVALPKQPHHSPSAKEFACFGRLLLRKCQGMFESGPTGQSNSRDLYHANIRFMAELYTRGVATSGLIQHCVLALLDQAERATQSTIGDSVLGLCEMLQIAGKQLDCDSSAWLMTNGWFHRIERLSDCRVMQSSLRGLLQALVQIRRRSWELGTRSAARAPAPGSGFRPAQLPSTKLERWSRALLMRWLGRACSLKDAKASFEELAHYRDISLFVKVSAEHLLTESSSELRQRGGELLFELLHCGLLSSQDVILGFTPMLMTAEDFLSDFPLLASYLGEIFSSFVQPTASYLGCVHQLLLRVQADLRDSSGRVLRSQILSRALHLASGRLGHDRVGAAFRETAIAWPDLLQLPQPAATEFVSAKDLKFTEG